MRIARSIGVFLLVYIVQVVIISRISIYNVRPDIILIFLTLYAVTFGAEEGLTAGFISGAIQDLLGGTFFIFTISRALLGFLVGTFKESVFGSEEVVSLTAVFVATVTAFLIEAILLYFFYGRPFASLSSLFLMLLLSCVMNSLLAPIVYPLVRRASLIMAEER